MQCLPDINVKVRVCVEAPTPAEELRFGLSSAPFSVASKCKVNFTVFFTSDLPTQDTISWYRTSIYEVYTTYLMIMHQK